MWADGVKYDSAEVTPVLRWRVSQRISALGMLKVAFVAGLIASIAFLVFPNLDLDIARIFYNPDAKYSGVAHFLGNHMRVFDVLRLLFNLVFYLACAATFLGLVFASRPARSWLGLESGKWIFVALCLIMGPLVVTNIGFKDHWGRARPRDVIEFGGTKAFTPPIPPSTQCQYNCSFISGEASSAFIVFFAAAFLFEAWATSLVVAGIVVGALAGLTRMAQGAHFLSDVVFAGVAMALTAAAIKLLCDAIKSAPRAEHAEVVRKAVA